MKCSTKRDRGAVAKQRRGGRAKRGRMPKSRGKTPARPPRVVLWEPPAKKAGGKPRRVLRQGAVAPRRTIILWDATKARAVQQSERSTGVMAAGRICLQCLTSEAHLHGAILYEQGKELF